MNGHATEYKVTGTIDSMQTLVEVMIYTESV
jgi:hypothetical protein